MGDRTKIEWADATWNPTRGCSRVSEGCRHCYAERMAGRFSGPGLAYEGLAAMHGNEARWTGELRLVPEVLELPLRWARPRRIFVDSMSDLFHERMPAGWIDRVFSVMARAPQHQFLILTKRPQRMQSYVALAGSRAARRAEAFATWPLPNVWLGVSVESEATAFARIPVLLETRAALRFLSCEPLLGPIDLRPFLAHKDVTSLRITHGSFDADVLLSPLVEIGIGTADVIERPAIGWVITGGESGPHSRPMQLEWARALRDQCARAGVPFFFKQWGDWRPDGDRMVRVGKGSAGSRLDGVQHREIPSPERMPNA